MTRADRRPRGPSYGCFFDDEHVYVGGRCWESHPENIAANELRQDRRGISGNDSFSFSFDTFYDRRSLVYS